MGFSVSRLALVLIIAVAAAAPVAAQSVQLPMTGTTKSVVAGDDGANQWGRAWPTDRFLDNGDGTISDRLTGLMWLKHGTCLGKQSIGANSVTAVAGLNGGSTVCKGYTASHTDWHLPTINELASLTNGDENHVNSLGWLALQGFDFSGIDSQVFTSSTSRTSTSRYDLDFSNDGIAVHTSGTFWVWPVRVDASLTPVSAVPNSGQTASYYTGDDGDLKPGVTWPTPRFTDNADGTVLDNLTGLTWLKDANCMNATYYVDLANANPTEIYGRGAVPWASAVAFAARVNGDPNSPRYLGGGWRLANRNELRSLIDHSSGTLPAGHPFTNLQSNTWSSTGNSDGNAWRLTMTTGAQSRLATTNTGYVMLVRGGYKTTFNVTVDATNEMLPFVQTGETSDALVVHVNNNGNEPQPIPDLGLTGAGADQFKLQSDGCSMTTLAPATSCTIEISFAPTKEGFSLATLEIPYRNGLSSTGTRSVTLRGNAWNGPRRAFTRQSGQVTSHASKDDAFWKSGVRWPEPRFRDNGDGTVFDRLTGLTWMKDTTCASLPNGGSTSYSKARADLDLLNAGTNDCGDYKKGTYSDWRIPNINELLSLFNFEFSDQTTWLSGIFQNLSTLDYWSATNDFEMRMTLSSTIDGYIVVDDGSARLWPVRGVTHGPAPIPQTGISSSVNQYEGYFQFGVPWPEPRFVQNGDGTFTDNLTGLTWIKDLGCIAQSVSQTRLNYSEALDAIAQLNGNPASFSACGTLPTGVSDWRLPNVLEILSLADWSNRSVLPNLFDGGQGGGSSKFTVWTSNTYGTLIRGFNVRLDQMEIQSDSLSNDMSVIAVRGGPLSTVVLAPPAHDFGTTNFGDPVSHTFTVTVGGNAPVGIGSPTSSDPQFTIANDTCTDALLDPAGNKSCTFDVVFNPNKAGLQAATIKVFSDVTATVNGSGLKPLIGVSKSTLDFGTTTVGDTSDVQSITVSNTGDGMLKIGEVTASTDFTVTENLCAGKALAKNESCTISIAATPKSAGSLQGALTIASNDADTPSKEVQLFVVADLASIEAKPPSLTFADTKIGTATQAQTITVTSNGPGTLVIGSVSIGGTDADSFAIDLDGCSGTKLKSTESCTITVISKPVAATDLVASVSIPSNADGVPTTTIDLSGKGLSAPALTFEPATLDYGDVPAGGTSEAKIVTLTSYGTEDVTITSIAASDATHFTVDPNGGDSPCGSLPKTLKPGESCTFSVTFTPELEQAYSGTLSIDSTHSGGLLQQPLSGKGTAEPNIEVSPASHDFGSVNVGQKSAAQVITIANTLNSILSVTQISLGSSTEFTLDLNGGSNPCASQVKVLKPNESCTVSVTFSPTSTGAKSATLTISSNDPDTPQVQIALSGTGITTPAISATPSSVDFGTVAIGATSESKTITIKNEGGGPLTVTKLTSDSAQIQIVSGDSNDCGTLPKILAPNESCSVTVRYKPTQEGTLSANLTISSDDPNNAELKVTLGGTGQGAPTVDVTDDDSQGGTADTSGGGTSKKGGGCSTAESGEPSAPWLLLVGLIGLVVWRRRQRRDVVGESAGE
ncbi:MAG: choice-of-anchor D domain-containing protein [Myxococcales bacterium]|nr:choice-of-anchor D domain-containing protein [Myxococcales bacterium]